MEEKRSVVIKRVAYFIIITNLILLLLSFLHSGIIGYQFFIFIDTPLMDHVFLIFICLFTGGIILGIGILLLNNIARLIFIVFQVFYAIILLPSFVIVFIFGLYTGGLQGDDARWASPVSIEFWQQITRFSFTMSVFVIPLLLSIFYIIFFTRPKVKEQFKWNKKCRGPMSWVTTVRANERM